MLSCLCHRAPRLIETSEQKYIICRDNKVESGARLATPGFVTGM